MYHRAVSTQSNVQHISSLTSSLSSLLPWFCPHRVLLFCKRLLKSWLNSSCADTVQRMKMMTNISSRSHFVRWQLVLTTRIALIMTKRESTTCKRMMMLMIMIIIINKSTTNRNVVKHVPWIILSMSSTTKWLVLQPQSPAIKFVRRRYEWNTIFVNIIRATYIIA